MDEKQSFIYDIPAKGIAMKKNILYAIVIISFICNVFCLYMIFEIREIIWKNSDIINVLARLQYGLIEGIKNMGIEPTY